MIGGRMRENILKTHKQKDAVYYSADKNCKCEALYPCRFKSCPSDKKGKRKKIKPSP
jgi:hypothetical protein